MQEAEAGVFIEGLPISARLLQQTQAALDIGADKLPWFLDGAIHVALGGKVDDRARTVAGKKGGHQIGVADIPLHKDVPRLSGETSSGSGGCPRR